MIGVLALQGDFEAHRAALGRVGSPSREVRRARDLEGLSGLILPGGESTALLNLMRDEPWFEAIRSLHSRGGALLGTCAGAILLAREVEPSQPSLSLLDVRAERNAYGRQVQSFETPLSSTLGAMAGVFIRAPRLSRLGSGVAVLASQGGDPVLVREGRVLAATFHPELSEKSPLHEELVRLAA